MARVCVLQHPHTCQPPPSRRFCRLSTAGLLPMPHVPLQARMLGFAELAKLVKEWERRQHAHSKQVGSSSSVSSSDSHAASRCV